MPECGKYCIEEEDDEEDGGKGAVLRRLVFLCNQHVIQSEVRLVPPKRSSAGAGGGGGGKKKGGKGGKKASSSKKGNKSSASSAAANGGEDQEEGGDSLVMDWTYLCFDYHKAILAGLIGLMYPQLKAARLAGQCLRCLQIGLGGGGLPTFLRKFIPCLDVTVVELEGGLAEVAKQWFGFRESAEEGLRIEEGDGLRRIQESASQAWDVIIVDVDNKDVSLGISCPGPDFVTPSFFQVGR